MEANAKEEELNQEENQQVNLPALEDYRKLFSHALNLYEIRNFEDSAKCFLEIYEKFPQQPEALINYGNCQYELLNIQEALEAWKKAKEQDKYLFTAYLSLGNYYLANENYVEAINEFQVAFCLNPHHEMLLVNLAIAYEKMNDKKKAFLLYEFYLAGNLNINSSTYKNIHKKVTMHKLNAISQMKLGIYFEKKGFSRKAIQAYYDALRVFPNFAKTYINIGNIFYKLEKYEQAKLYWLEAYKIDKKSKNLVLNLAICSEKLEDTVDAYAFYTEFIQNSYRNNSDVILAQKAAEKLHTQILANNAIVNEYKKKCEELEKAQKYEDALVCYGNFYAVSHSNEIKEKINSFKAKTNILHQSALTLFEMAKELYAQGKYEYAMDKCKLSTNLWRNSYFEQSVFNLISKCQTALGHTINNMLKAKHE